MKYIQRTSPVGLGALLILMFSCSTPSSSSKLEPQLKFVPDVDLIQDWTEEAQQSEPYQPPFVIRYSEEHKQLSFIAVRHSRDLESDTFRLVKTEIEKFQPEIVIIEGQSSDRNAWAIMDRVRQCANDGFKDCGESLYAAHIAVQNSIPFRGGESPDESIFEKVSEKGYTAQDFAGFYAFRMIAHHPVKNRGEMAKVVDSSLENTFTAIGKRDPNFRHNSFYQWFLEKTGLDFEHCDPDPRDTVPGHRSRFPFIQKLELEITRERDAHLLDLISTQLNEKSRVLVVYGAGHHVEVKRALSAWFKKSVAEKPF